ncbi:hypothetical protein PEC18_34695 [Paucibacter sp. O1-1]|nr:hypothetical protein [Paucibacter sp. O1-1]MDA3830830.1 hypothetical protein [Paucibacter sp. O1-1]
MSRAIANLLINVQYSIKVAPIKEPTVYLTANNAKGDLCDSSAMTTYIRKALVLTMSGSTANFTVSQNGSVINDFDTDIQDIANGDSATFNWYSATVPTKYYRLAQPYL